MSASPSPSSFRIGPLSPPSPSSGSLKASRASPSKVLTPQSPTSPPLMSVGAQNYASSFNLQPSPGLATLQGPSFSSPPSSTPMSTQVSQQATMSITNSFPTPASSVNGHLIGTIAADDISNGEKSFASRALSSGTESLDRSQSGHRRTDHDRHEEGFRRGGIPGLGMNAAAQTCLENNSMMDLEHDPQADGGLSLSLASLQNDIGAAFHLCKNSHTMSGPDPSMDLVSLYGLGPIAKSVMRADPVTGEKINRLRKSYEGKLKGLGLAGRNKPVKHEPGTPGGLRQMTMWPEEEWQNQKVFGKEIDLTKLNSTLYELQMKSMKMEPGPVPNHEYWEDLLGHEKLPKHVMTPAEVGKKAVTTPSTTHQPSQPNGAPVVAEPERVRPSRGKKRHYDDNSFVGYGEGYADDDDEAAFYSNNEEAARAAKKKRKKDHVTKVPPVIPERQGTYGVGMFGIGAR